jgi:hypothetical protein
MPELARHPLRVFVLADDGLFRVNPEIAGRGWRIFWDKPPLGATLQIGVRAGSNFDHDPTPAARRILRAHAPGFWQVRPGAELTRLGPDQKGMVHWYVPVDMTAPLPAACLGRMAAYRQPYGRRRVVCAAGAVWG